MTEAPTPILTLVEFLRARILEEQAAARAASPGGWQYGDVESVAGGMLYDESRTIASLIYEQTDDHDGSIVRHLLPAEADANGRHIALHDPDSVLADCAARLKIIELHESWPVLLEGQPRVEPDLGAWPVGNEAVYKMTQRIAWLTVREYRARFGEEPPTGPILRLLAARYADHSDFRDEWL